MDPLPLAMNQTKICKSILKHQLREQHREKESGRHFGPSRICMAPHVKNVDANLRRQISNDAMQNTVIWFLPANSWKISVTGPFLINPYTCGMPGLPWNMRGMATSFFDSPFFSCIMSNSKVNDTPQQRQQEQQQQQKCKACWQNNKIQLHHHKKKKKWLDYSFNNQKVFTHVTESVKCMKNKKSKCSKWSINFLCCFIIL